MTTTHELKTWPRFYSDVVNGWKTFELRRDDRGFKEGDNVRLVEWNPGMGTVTGRSIEKRIGVIVRGAEAEQFGLMPGFCIFSLLPMEVL